MARSLRHKERHLVARVGWLRAAVLGANDGLVSTASLIMGVAAASSGRTEILIAGVAGLVAGAMSMAAGEYVSVSSQSDTENADIDRERAELAADPDGEREELAAIYRKRGLTADLAAQVADQLMAKDALAAHARDELNITELTVARPVTAAVASALSFTAGAAVPLICAAIAPASVLIEVTACIALLCLGLLGAIGARAGGAPVGRAMLRVTFWGALAMAITAGIGHLTGSVV